MSQTPHQVCCFRFRSGRKKEKLLLTAQSICSNSVYLWVLGIPGYGTYVCLCEPLHFACYCALHMPQSVFTGLGCLRNAWLTLVLVTFYMPYNSKGIS